jgi:hypothetical protein
MQIRSVIKLGVVLSVVLFCIGIAFYGFARLSMADKENRVDIFEFVPKDCAGILETDNIDNFMHVFSQAAYSSQLDTLHRAGLMNDILSDLSRYSSAANSVELSAKREKSNLPFKLVFTENIE